MEVTSNKFMGYREMVFMLLMSHTDFDREQIEIFLTI